MYESPINIQELTRDIQQNIKQDLEKKVIESIWEYEIKVDKEELIKALQYDRNQYEKGFTDALGKIRAEIIEVYNDRPSSYNHTQRKELFCKVIEIIDKYKESGEKE